ncbi:MAG TPA: TadE/TadG family type IV pilus assembly protein [Bauldia sp.]|nr:TadE/TadG family type IV pilus assembly protein [Bauldia sp.]
MFMNFLRDVRANVAPIFAIAAIPLIVVTGGVVDYSRAFDQRTVVQDSLDSAALAAGKKLGIWDEDQLKTEANDFFASNLGTKVEQVPTLTSTITPTTLTLNTTLHVKTYFLGLIGLNEFVFNLTSQTTVSTTRLRVALVLDNTLSMNDDGKMGALKTATTSLLNQLKGIANVNGDVYVSIVPFVTDVNAGNPFATNPSSTADWMQFDDSTCTPTSSSCDAWWDGANGSCKVNGSNSSRSPRSRCLTQGSCSVSGTSYGNCATTSGCFVNGNYTSSYTTSSTCTASGACSSSSYTTQSTCLAVGSCSVTSGTYSNCTSTKGCFVNGTYSSGYSQSQCTSANNKCDITSKTSQNSCTTTYGCFINGTYNSSYTSQNSCTRQRNSSWQKGTWTTTAWSSGTWNSTYSWTAKTPGTWSTGTWSAVWTPKAHSTWNGCVSDRGASWSSGPGTSAAIDQLATTPDPATPSTLFPAEQYSSCPQAVIGLSYDWTALQTEVTNMVSAGYTNQPIGLAWGWQSLVGGGPFTVPAMDPDHEYQQIIILLSDGLNTEDRWYSNASSIDTRMYNTNTGAGTCANVKAAGITIYTVQVDTGGDPTSTLLQNCASDTSKFFKLTSADDIITTFNNIGTQLSQLRIAM